MGIAKISAAELLNAEEKVVGGKPKKGPDETTLASWPWIAMIGPRNHTRFASES